MSDGGYNTLFDTVTLDNQIIKSRTVFTLLIWTNTVMTCQISSSILASFHHTAHNKYPLNGHYTYRLTKACDTYKAHDSR